jgi:uncharacterized membrane protein
MYPPTMETRIEGTPQGYCNYSIANKVIIFVFAIVSFIRVYIGSMKEIVRKRMPCIDAVFTQITAVWALVGEILLTVAVAAGTSRNRNRCRLFPGLNSGCFCSHG